MTRWIAAALMVAGIFLLSAGIGGLVARQLRSSTPTPVTAVATPTPSAPVATSTATLESPTAGPSPTPSPSAVPTPSPSAAVPPATATPSLPSASASPSIPAAPTPDVATLEPFVRDLAAAIRRGRDPYLVDRLHPVVIERYGEPACLAHVADSVSGGAVRWEILEASGPAPWPYASDDLETIVAETWTVRVRQPGADPEERELHFAFAEGTWRWFTDCGEPL